MLARFFATASLVGLAVTASLVVRDYCPDGSTAVCCSTYDLVSSEFFYLFAGGSWLYRRPTRPHMRAKVASPGLASHAAQTAAPHSYKRAGTLLAALWMK
ncbi:hypothetical protein M405DRAFT_928682 [Rhizopogon salebrosus TDB-379]|nr:hypothetical protein M405DRAFT_928682 [Rhizopogon salebrosus TDB-379]